MNNLNFIFFFIWIFQSPFNQYGFYLIGSGDATDLFAVNEQNCDITIARDLSSDSATSYTVRHKSSL